MDATLNTTSLEKPSLDGLKHFGVRGMKWGLRRSLGKAGKGTVSKGGGKYLTKKRAKAASQYQTTKGGRFLTKKRAKQAQTRIDRRAAKKKETSEKAKASFKKMAGTKVLNTTLGDVVKQTVKFAAVQTLVQKVILPKFKKVLVNSYVVSKTGPVFDAAKDWTANPNYVPGL